MRKAPSNSLTFERTFFATKNATSSGISEPSRRDLVIKIATLISNSGGSMATVRPESNLETKRSCISAKPFG